MSIRTPLSRWQIQLVCTAVYALAYLLLREVTMSQWNMLTSLRLASLLLLPCRYWPALAVGEGLPLILENERALQQLGHLWFGFASLPPILLLMPLVFGLRRILPRPGRQTGEHVPGLLLLVLLASIAISLRGLLQYSIGPLGNADGQPLPWFLLASRYLIGNFLPAVTFLPLVLLASEYPSPIRRQQRPRCGRLAPQTIELVLALLLITGITCWGGISRHGIRLGFQLSLLLPVLWLALRRGWRPAAMASAAGSIGLMLIMPRQHDLATLEAETIYAFIVTTVLLLGARTSIWRQAVDERDGSARMARQSLYSHELKLRQSARTLTGLHQALQLTHARLMQRLQLTEAAPDAQRIRRELGDLGALLERLSRSLAFSPWYAPGLSGGATSSGNVGQTLQGLGMNYHADPCGQLSLLPADVMTVLSRLSCEILAQLILRDTRQDISIRSSTAVQARGGLRVQLVAECSGPPLPLPMRGPLLASLGANGMDFDEIRAMARLFHGDCSVGPAVLGGTRVSLILCILPSRYSRGHMFSATDANMETLPVP